MKPGMERVLRLLDRFGAPHERLGTVVHIAGTNGKGTTASALAAIFQAAGKKTALYTSPHLLDFTERMRVNGRPITPERVAAYCSAMQDAVVSLRATFFEATTALAFAWFADERVEVSVIEAGMGGRFDATNVVRSDYAVITSVALDHTAWLGSSLEMIAQEKAAIIKPGSTAFTAVRLPEPLVAVRRAAARNGVRLFQLGVDLSVTVSRADSGSLECSVSTLQRDYHRLQAPVTGAFHAENLALAVTVAEQAGIEEVFIREGFRSMLKTGYRGRLEKVGSEPDILLDVSHNADGMRCTAEAVAVFRNRYRAMYVLLGMVSDKDARSAIRFLKPLDAEYAAVPVSSGRTLPATRLGAILRQEGMVALVFDTPEEGFEHLLLQATSRDLVLVTGSFFLAGEILRLKRFQER